MNRCFELSLQLTASQRGSLAFSVLSPFHQLWCLSQPLPILLNKPAWQITLCSSSAGLVFCHTAESNQFTEGSNEPELWAHAEGGLCERAFLLQAVAVSCRLAHHVLRPDGRRLILSCRSQEEFFSLTDFSESCTSTKVKLKPWIFLFTVTDFCIFFCSFLLLQGKTWITLMVCIQYLEKWQKAWMYWRQLMKLL